MSDGEKTKPSRRLKPLNRVFIQIPKIGKGSGIQVQHSPIEG